MSDMSDPFYNWRLRAAAATGVLHYSADLVNEAAGIVSVVFGREWLASVAEAPDHSSVFHLGRHPLGHALTAGGESQVVDVLELAGYLKTASRLPGFHKMVTDLKSQFRQTLLPLALAHRLGLVGSLGLALEPAASGGRLADLGLSWNGQDYLIECYRPTVAGQPEEHTGRLLMGILGEFSIEERPFAVAVQLRRPLDHQVRKAVLRAVAQAKRDLEARAFREALLIDNPSALISIAPTEIAPAGQDSVLVLHPGFPRLPNRRSQFARAAIGTRDALNVVNPKLESPTHSCVAVWTHEADAADPLYPDPEAAFKRVVRKVNRKMAQTRSEQGARRLVVVDTWVTDQLDRLRLDAGDYVHAQVLSQRRGPTSVLFVRRAWDRRMQRSRYSYRLFAGPNDAAARSLCEALSSWEHANLVPALVR